MLKVNLKDSVKKFAVASVASLGLIAPVVLPSVASANTVQAKNPRTQVQAKSHALGAKRQLSATPTYHINQGPHAKANNSVKPSQNTKKQNKGNIINKRTNVNKRTINNGKRGKKVLVPRNSRSRKSIKPIKHARKNVTPIRKSEKMSDARKAYVGASRFARSTKNGAKQDVKNLASGKKLPQTSEARNGAIALMSSAVMALAAVGFAAVSFVRKHARN